MMMVWVFAQALAAGVLIAVGAGAAALGALALALGPQNPNEWESHYMTWGLCALVGAVTVYLGMAIVP